ncbi:MAG: hypothetical protein ABIJ83_02640 [Patescibacteria group bacterium]
MPRRKLEDKNIRKLCKVGGGKKGNLYYQIFIEPKGGQFADKEGEFKESKEGWKEKFLQQITDKYGNGSLLKAENKNYKLTGLPLFNKKTENNFEKMFSEQSIK